MPETHSLMIPFCFIVIITRKNDKKPANRFSDQIYIPDSSSRGSSESLSEYSITHAISMP